MGKFLLSMLLISACLLSGCGSGGAIGGGSNSPVLTSLQVTPNNASVVAGLTQRFTATGEFSDGSTRDLTASVTWSSSNANIATINFSGTPGLAKGVAPGNVTISASSNSASGTAPLTVTHAVPTAIAVSPGNLTLPLGLHQQFTAIATLSDGTTQDMTSSVTWSSSDPNVLTLSAAGFASTNATGACVVTATAGNVSGHATVSVGPVQPVSLALAPWTPVIAAGASQQFTASLNFSDGTSQDVTAGATWSSSAPLIAPTPSQGLTQTRLAGLATISATANGLSSSTVLTVKQSSAQPGIHVRFRSNSNPTPGTNRYSDVVGEARTINGVSKMYAYVASWRNNAGVQIIDVTNPDAPVLAATYAPTGTSDNMQGVQVSNGIGYFASDTGGGVHIVDLSNPATPQLITRILPSQQGRFSDSVHDITLDATGQHLYIPGYPHDNTIEVWNVSDPQNPTLVRTFNGSDALVHDVTVRGNRLFAAGWNGTSDIFDITNIDTQVPQLLGSFASGVKTQDASFSSDGKFVFCPHEITNPGGVAVFDISNPSSPTLVADLHEKLLGIQATSPSTSKVMGNYLFVAWYQAGVVIFDVSDPRNPILVGNYDTWPGSSTGGTGGGNGDWGVWPFLGMDKILVSDRTTGLYVLDATAVSTEPAVFGLSLNPNPVVGGTPATGTVFLIGRSPAGGVKATISSNNPGAPGQTVNIPAAGTNATFVQSTPTVGTTTNVTVTATDGAFSSATVLQVTP